MNSIMKLQTTNKYASQAADKRMQYLIEKLK